MTRPLDSTLSILGTGAALCAGLLISSEARGAPDKDVPQGSVVMMSGVQYMKKLTLAGRIRVAPFTAGDASSGWLRIVAHEIAVTASGEIDATGSGFAGAVAGGDGPGAGGSPTVVVGTASPGGGGGHFGVGIRGLDGSCNPFPDADGGPPYDTGPIDLAAWLAGAQSHMGSAGGTSHSGSPNDKTTPGGNGGGTVILDSARISFAGTILAAGVNASSALGVTPGGGAGGTVIVRAAELTAPAGASIAAGGGTGARKTSPVGSFGGSGGGGVILLVTDGDVASLLAACDVGGGAGSIVCTVNSPKGGDGLAQQIAGALCNDADGDGFENALCGGPDCDDGDPAINPDAAEACDGIDNNCAGGADENPESLCPQGSNKTCEGGACVLIEGDGGTGAGGVGLAPFVELGGGLCASSGGPVGARPGTAAWLAVALGLAGLARRRARR